MLVHFNFFCLLETVYVRDFNSNLFSLANLLREYFTNRARQVKCVQCSLGFGAN